MVMWRRTHNLVLYFERFVAIYVFIQTQELEFQSKSLSCYEPGLPSVPLDVSVKCVILD